jgi:hypothetical protein
MTTLSKTSDCHATLIYIQTQPDGSIKAYIYDPNGKGVITSKKCPLKINVAGIPVSQVDISMTPDTGINPEGFCALWSIVVMILWDINMGLDFDRRVGLLISFNQRISGPQKIPGLRKWFITTVHNLFMRSKEYIPSVTAQFVQDVQQQITWLLTDPLPTHVGNAVRAITTAIGRESAGTIATATYDAMVDEAVMASIGDSAGAGAGAGAGASIGHSGHSGRSGRGGGINRVRSIRLKNKMYRRMKMRKTRRIVKTRSRRSRQKK